MSELQHSFWHKPRHHEDLEEKNDHVAWIELFYDLIHVVCIFLLGDFLSHHISISGFLICAGLFSLIWMAWADTVFYTSLYVTNDVIHRLIMGLQICTIMVFAASIPNIAHHGATYFAIAYGCNRLLLSLMYWRCIQHDDQSAILARELSRNFLIIGLLFIASAWLPSPYIYWAWGGITILSNLGYIAPKFGVMRILRFTPRIDHLSERFALLMLIVIGEGFFKLVLTLADKGIATVSIGILCNFIASGLSLCALAWIYFDFIGNGRIIKEKSHMMRWWYGHYVLMFTAIMLAVAFKGEVLVGFNQPFPLKYAFLGCFGLAIYLATSYLIETSIERRENHAYYDLKLRLFGIVLVMLTLVAVPFVPAILSNAMYLTALFSQVIVPVMRSR